VAHDELRQALAYRGVDPNIIHVTGIPIKPSFNRRPSANDPDQLRVLMMAGGIRNGGYVKVKNQVTQILHSLDGLDPSKLEITIVAGNQPHLEQELGKLARESRYRLNVRGFVNNMEDLMCTHDILVAKPGGLIVAEALSSGIPLILSQPGPGVETANMEFLVRHGVALPGETADDVIESLHFCVENPEAVHRMKLEARKLGFPNSSGMITNHISNHLSMGELQYGTFVDERKNLVSC
jgi:processive 1,2-diacylglycerol beta-glucosyltransferase